MNYKCHGCFYMGERRDDSDRYPICKRKLDHEDGKTECEKNGPCVHYLSCKEANKIIDKFNENLK